ncbi:Alanine racemase [Pseudodesulfovibrio profundus]|uniref:Alanine racemase n=1 Tax=Pseudodesulfovibrio profundus TaxID=57320 RepID=A0A2C8FAB0_9BACT|nr:alanine racemase [Pseudodesulfovibrio profundus]SOB59493.1 Alanine racemase [Pseudodesulfovibrio profundus]
MTIDYNKLEVRINLDNLRHNYRIFTRFSDNVIPIIKSDAYGHGLAEVSRALENDASTFGVGFVNEAVLLRRSGCKQRIMALLGPIDDADFQALWDHEILAAMSHMGQLERAAAMAEERGTLNIGLKIDTGMRRLGFRPEEVDELIEFLKGHSKLKPVMVTSHLASADVPEHKEHVHGQARAFEAVVGKLREAGFDVEANLANSAGSMVHPPCHMDSLRLGISLYGGNPLHGTQWADAGQELKPAMDVSAPVMQVHPLGKGEGISYGWTHVAERDCMVAIIGAGYADCYSRSLSGKGFVNIAGRRAPVLGRVCMQMTAVDVTDILGEGTEVVPGDRAWLLGGPGDAAITPEELADWWGTITYEVFCLLGMNQRIYT